MYPDNTRLINLCLHDNHTVRCPMRCTSLRIIKTDCIRPVPYCSTVIQLLWHNSAPSTLQHCRDPKHRDAMDAHRAPKMTMHILEWEMIKDVPKQGEALHDVAPHHADRG